jgi:hypothetical protein
MPYGATLPGSEQCRVYGGIFVWVAVRVLKPKQRFVYLTFDSRSPAAGLLVVAAATATFR